MELQNYISNIFHYKLFILYNHHIVMKEVLGSIETLQDFKLESRQVAPIYHNTLNIPSLLINNLKSQHRIIKQFNGQDAILKAFYFNLFKLAFQLQNEDKNYGKIVRQVFTGYKQFSQGQLQDLNFSDKQYRNFLNEFMDILESQQIANFQQTIKYYPIVDEFLLSTIKKIVPFTLLIKDNKEQIIIDRVLKYLATFFQLNIQKVNQIYKCLQSDIFFYAMSLDKVYLIFVNQLAFIKEVTQQSHSQQRKSIKLSQSSRTDNGINTKKSIESIHNWNNDKKGQMHNKKSFNTVISILNNNNSLNKKKEDQSLKSWENKIKSSNVNNQMVSKYPEFQRKKYAQNEYNEQNYQKKQKKLHEKKQDAFIKQKYYNSDYNYNIKPSSIDNYSDKTDNSKISQHKKYNDNQLFNFNDYSKLQNTVSLDESIGNNSSSYVNWNYKQTLPTATNNYPEEKSKSLFFSTEIVPKKYSHLEVNSNVKQNIKQTKSQFKKMRSNQDVMQITDDSGFQKFTDSKILECLDDEFKIQIRHIKKQYRQKRKNIRQL